MNYSDYTTEQVIKSVINYEDVCTKLIDLGKDEETKRKLGEILYNGGFDGYRVSTTFQIRGNPNTEAKKRIAVANLLIRNPETFEFFRANGINLYHGTNANALSSILYNGLKSHSKSKAEGINVITGEASTRYNHERSFVSLTDVLDLARGYATLHPQGGEEQLSFPVLFCMNEASIKGYIQCWIDSDLPEIGIKDGIAPKDIIAVCVPSEKVEFVKKLASETGIEVLAADGFDESFYYVDEFEEVLINEEKYKALKDKSEPKKQESFSLKSLKELACKRKFKDIIVMLKKMGIEPQKIGDLENDGRKH